MPRKSIHSKNAKEDQDEVIKEEKGKGKGKRSKSTNLPDQKKSKIDPLDDDDKPIFVNTKSQEKKKISFKNEDSIEFSDGEEDDSYEMDEESSGEDDFIVKSDDEEIDSSLVMTIRNRQKNRSLPLPKNKIPKKSSNSKLVVFSGKSNQGNLMNKSKSKSKDVDIISIFETELSPLMGNKGSQSLLKEAIIRIFSRLDEDGEAESKINQLVENVEWEKMGMDVDKYQQELMDLKKAIKDDIPNVGKILMAPISFQEKKKALELLEVFNNTEPSTEEYYTRKNSLKELLKVDCGLDIQQRSQLVEFEELMKNKVDSSIDSIKYRIMTLNASDDIKKRLYNQYQQLLLLDSNDAEYRNSRQKLMIALDLPYETIVEPQIECKGKKPTAAEINAYISNVRQKLDEELYGMEEAKGRVLEILTNRITNPSHKGSAIALVGLPGIGKSFFARALAAAMNVPCEVLSAGGLEDASIIKGSDGKWVGSSPSILLQMMKRMGCSNGVIVIDEIDKLGNSQNGKQVQYALLHVTDPSHNHQFTDSYLEGIPHDLSKILFVYTMNHKDWLDDALLDRLPDIIEIPNYNVDEKKIIVTDYLLPNVLKNVGMKDKDIKFTDEGLDALFDKMAPSMETSGIRALAEELKSIVSRVNFIRTNLLPNKTLGNLKVSYFIPNFKLPLTIDKKIFFLLTKK